MLSPKLINGDWVIENGELIMVDGTEELAQCCAGVLNVNKKEWFLNPELGIPFLALTGKGVTKETIDRIIRQGLRQESRIQTVDSIAVTMDSKNRTCAVSFTATATSGETISEEVTTGGIG